MLRRLSGPHRRRGPVSTVTKGTEANSDERIALQLLKEHLVDHAGRKFRCMVNANDPPDLIIKWEKGERWGVEVTRTYQQVSSIDESRVVSSETIYSYFSNFSEHLKKTFIGQCERGYVLYLEGPAPFSSWKPRVSSKKWKNEVEEAIREYIVSGRTKPLKFDGGRLRASEIGGQWLNIIGAPATEINSSIDAMFYRTLQDKTKDLPRWGSEFDQCWLLLLNCHPLVDDVAEVERALRRLTRKHQGLNGFRDFFWSGCIDRRLVPISLELNPALR